MALLSLLTGNTLQRTRFQGGPSGPDLMLVDAVLSLAPEYEAELTEHPVEEGSDITDHIRVKNIKLQMSGVASETPINLAASLQGLTSSIAGAIGAKLGGQLGASVGAAAGGFGAALLKQSQSPADEMREFLIRLLESRKTFTLWTPQKRYDDLVLTNVTFPKDQSTGRALRFSAQMRQIRIVKSQVVRLDNVADNVLHTASKSSKLGKKSTTLTDDQTGKQSSLLFSGLQTVGAIK